MADDAQGHSSETPRHMAEAPKGGHFSSRAAKREEETPLTESRHMAPAPVSPYTRPMNTQPWQKSTGDWPKDLIEPEEAKGSALKSVIEWVVVIACALGVAFLVRTFVVEPFEIPSESMLETIKVGDRILGEKLTYLNGAPETGDIVTFLDPEDPETTLIKRVIATPGQTIDLVDGKVAIDGELIEEPYVQGETFPLPSSSSTLSEPVSFPYTLGEDEYWVMGDNRENSLDSRYFGPIRTEDVTSKAWIVFWPPEDFGVLS